VLSALWNLSAHSTENKAAICQVDGALGFLVSTLTYRCQGNSLAVIESGGGILRNVSSLIATREDYRSAPITIHPNHRGREWEMVGEQWLLLQRTWVWLSALHGDTQTPLTPVPRDPVPSSYIRGHQAHMWHTDKHPGITTIHRV
jgi:hypothetical protein